jgi:hypothetical protein
MVLAGYPWPGTILGSVDIVGLVAIFVTGKYFGSRDEEKHTKMLAEAMRQQEDEDKD